MLNQFLSDLRQVMSSDRIYTDELRTLGWGTDASFYRQIPKVVVRSDGEAEISKIVQLCRKYKLPFTFRAAGTSLSGQSCTDSVLIVAGKHWEKYQLMRNEELEMRNDDYTQGVNADNKGNQHSSSLISHSSLNKTITLDRNTHQAHVMIGAKAYRFDNPRRMTLYLLNNIIGGPGMNARLNLSLRERHGLVYTVESSMAAYSDAGVWSVYFGCDHHDVNRCLRLVRRELDRMMFRPLSASQLSAAKRQLKGQLAIACDNREQFALDFGRNYLHHGNERNLDVLFRKIDAVTAEDIQKVAGELFPADNLTILIIR